jgi:hypothetical protein
VSSTAGFRLLGQKGSTSGVFEHLTNTLVGLCRTFQVLVGTNLLAYLLTLLCVLVCVSRLAQCVVATRVCISGWSYLFRSDRLLAGLVKLLNRLLVVSQIFLTANKDDRKPAAEMQNFRDPLKSTCQQCLIIQPYTEIAGVFVPSPGRYQGNRESRQRSRSG